MQKGDTRVAPVLIRVFYGRFVMVGFNSINIGFAFGKDQALRDGGKSGGWVYNGKTWIGVIVAFNLINKNGLASGKASMKFLTATAC